MRHLCKYYSASIITSWETSGSTPEDGFSETSVLSSNAWNVSGIVVNCRGEYPARNWTGQTILRRMRNETAEMMGVNFMNMSMLFPGYGGEIFAGSPGYIWTWPPDIFRSRLSFGPWFWGPPDGFLIHLTDGYKNSVRLGGNIIANRTGGTLQSVQISGVKSNTCNTTCIGSACNVLHCTDASCYAAPVSGPSGRLRHSRSNGFIIVQIRITISVLVRGYLGERFTADSTFTFRFTEDNYNSYAANNWLWTPSQASTLIKLSDGKGNFLTVATSVTVDIQVWNIRIFEVVKIVANSCPSSGRCSGDSCGQNACGTSDCGTANAVAFAGASAGTSPSGSSGADGSSGGSYGEDGGGP
ncbi:hypothetical protein COCOBI_17-3430 [Coccomyxa sp. Obi]|nr:hypothetical protein COCOBI_17-3430 [Coccomyxa sp. Obi]